MLYNFIHLNLTQVQFEGVGDVFSIEPFGLSNNSLQSLGWSVVFNKLLSLLLKNHCYSPKQVLYAWLGSYSTSSSFSILPRLDQQP